MKTPLAIAIAALVLSAACNRSKPPAAPVNDAPVRAQPSDPKAGAAPAGQAGSPAGAGADATKSSEPTIGDLFDLVKSIATEAEGKGSSPGGSNPASPNTEGAGFDVGLPYPEGFVPAGECPDVGPTADAETVANASATIPLRAGLTLSGVWVGGGDNYDHECLKQVASVGPRSVVITVSCPIGKEHKLQNSRREVCRSDMRDAEILAPATHASFPDTMRGTVLTTLSRHTFSALTQGEAHHRYLDLSNRLHSVTIDLDYDGTLKREKKGTYPLIVNDRTVDVPVIEVVGLFTNQKRVRVVVLDDERFPLILDYQIPDDKFAIAYKKVSFPTTGDLEKHLATEKRVDVYGIYFDFASDALRPESEPVLREIAAALSKNPTWTLSINGHTDNVGGGAFNLELSQRRSASVRRALVDRFQIEPARLATSGYGAAQPKDSNDTPDGRARNRRVELVRQ